MEDLKQAAQARQQEARRQPGDTLVWLLAARRSTCFRRGLLILLPLAVSLAYFAGYRYLVQRPVEQRCGAVSPFTATVCDWPQETERGCRITVKLDGYPGAKAVLYGEPELLDARPGNTLAGTAQWAYTLCCTAGRTCSCPRAARVRCAGCPSGRRRRSGRGSPPCGTIRGSAAS